MPAHQSINPAQLKGFLDMMKTVHGVEAHPEGSMTLPTGHRVPADMGVYVENGNIESFGAALFPETGAMHEFTIFPDDGHHMLQSPSDLESSLGNTHTLHSDLPKNFKKGRRASFTPENVSEVLRGTSGVAKSSMDASYGPRDIVKTAGKNRGFLTVSELKDGTHSTRRYNLRDERFED